MMNQWYVKELSIITNVSVRTLHHYDRIGLLKPSLRMDNGYRVYSEVDLLKLQRIIALKFFGFSLSEIKALLKNEKDALQPLAQQVRFLQQKAEALLNARDILQKIIVATDDNLEIPWQKAIEMIGVYQMIEETNQSWAKAVLSEVELKQYAEFQKKLSTTDSKAKETFEKAWYDLCQEVRANVTIDPCSSRATEIAKHCMTLVNNLYGKEYAHLRKSVWEKGFKTGAIDDSHGLTPEMVTWLDQAIDHYYRQRIYTLLDTIRDANVDTALPAWQQLLEEMCGHDKAAEKELFNAALKEDRISTVAKAWLRRVHSTR